MIRKKWIILMFSLICFIFFQNNLWATFSTGLEMHPDWYVDEDIGNVLPQWNKGVLKCEPPRGGYNEITENQKIINSWGYRARPLEEIKNLLPEPIYNIFNNPKWGEVRINETAWEPIKPRGYHWEKFIKQSKKNTTEVYLDEKNWLRNYKYGIPFYELDEKDPKIAVKLIWNYFKRFQDNDRVVPMNPVFIDRRQHVRHNTVINRRMLLHGRNRDDIHTNNGTYSPNPQNLDFVFVTPYLHPYNLRGTIPLYYRYDDPDKPDDFWIYIPSIRRVRRMSTNQHQDRLPGGADWTWDTTEGFEGNLTRFNWTYLGREELLIPIIGHSHCYYSTSGYLNGMDQYYQRRNCYVIKASYKKPINMTEMVLYLDPLLYSACYSTDRDLKGRDWIIQFISQGRDKNWFYTMYNDWAFDIVTTHISAVLFSHSGGKGFVIDDFRMDRLKQEFLSR